VEQLRRHRQGDPLRLRHRLRRLPHGNNNNGPTTLTYDNATSCGRGFYSTTGSYNTTLTRCNANGSSGIGIWLGVISKNVKVNGGTLYNNAGGCWTDSNPSGSGNSVTVTCR